MNDNKNDDDGDDDIKEDHIDDDQVEDFQNSSKSRFIRVIAGQTLEHADTLLGDRVNWLERLLVFKSKAPKLNSEVDYTTARCVGMDAASALAVEALDPQPGLGILDLCCAPGMKLAAIAELMDKRGRLVGVDVSEMRLNTTAALLRKYSVALKGADDDNWDLTLWRCDGRTFNPKGDKGVLQWSTKMNQLFLGGKALRVPRKRAGKALRKALQAQARLETAEFAMDVEGFDRVLVDAECTTDGRAYETSTQERNYKRKKWTGENGAASSEEESQVEQLQLELLTNGFRLLKPGGFLVYSTCSLLEGQNEGVLSRFMEKEPRAKLVYPMPSRRGEGHLVPPHIVPSRTLGPMGWRLTPSVSGTSGLFIARLIKI